MSSNGRTEGRSLPCSGSSPGHPYMPSLSIDFETRSTVDLPETGVYVYAAHQDTAIWCMAWAFEGEEPEIIFPGNTALGPGQALPQRIVDHIASGGMIRAHNAAFERIMWRDCARRLYGWPEVPLRQWECSAAEAASMALPRRLGAAAQVLGVPFQKDEEGHRLMLRMCRPRSTKGGDLVWWDIAERLVRLGEYCKQDVRAEQSISPRMRRLSESERQVWLLDQRINDRGILLDVPLARGARAVVEQGLERSRELLIEATGGAVTAVTQVGKIKSWMKELGVPETALDKKSVEALLADAEQLPQVRMALEARKEAGRSSVAKINAMLRCRGEDNAMRGSLLYHGASTGRWAGTLFQPQNLPRGDMDDPEMFIPDVLAQDYDSINLCYPPLAVVSSLLRPMLIARPGHRFVAADFSGIEFRVVNWLAGQNDVLEVIRSGRDQYKVNASQMFGVPYEAVTKHQRQGGKAVELGCGFGMGWKKFQSTALAQHGLTLTEDESRKYVGFYRESHDKVVGFWKLLEQAAMTAVANPGERVNLPLSQLTFVKSGSLLWLRLPSGRLLCYPGARIIERDTPWGTTQPALQAYAPNPVTKQWESYDLYGGIWAENVTQAVARDIMADGMIRVEGDGYPVVLTVHDEIVTEPPTGFGSMQDFVRHLETVPDWADGCPINCEAWEGPRYRK